MRPRRSGGKPALPGMAPVKRVLDRPDLFINRMLWRLSHNGLGRPGAGADVCKTGCIPHEETGIFRAGRQQKRSPGCGRTIGACRLACGFHKKPVRRVATASARICETGKLRVRRRSAAAPVSLIRRHALRRYLACAFFSRSAASTTSGVSGIRRKRQPMAFATALAIAGAPGTMTISPIPRAP